MCVGMCVYWEWVVESQGSPHSTCTPSIEGSSGSTARPFPPIQFNDVCIYLPAPRTRRGTSPWLHCLLLLPPLPRLTSDAPHASSQARLGSLKTRSIEGAPRSRGRRHRRACTHHHAAATHALLLLLLPPLCSAWRRVVGVGRSVCGVGMRMGMGKWKLARRGVVTYRVEVAFDRPRCVLVHRPREPHDRRIRGGTKKACCTCAACTRARSIDRSTGRTGCNRVGAGVHRSFHAAVLAA